MKPANPRILTINGGSSSIKFALFEAGDSLRRILGGGIERIGLPEASLRVKGVNQEDRFSRPVAAPDHTVAVGALMDWIEERIEHKHYIDKPGQDLPEIRNWKRGRDETQKGKPGAQKTPAPEPTLTVR